MEPRTALLIASISLIVCFLICITGFARDDDTPHADLVAFRTLSWSSGASSAILLSLAFLTPGAWPWLYGPIGLMLMGLSSLSWVASNEPLPEEDN